jgi:protein-arginine deiminase
MTAVSARLEVDADRDGRVEPGERGRWDWQWSHDGVGAVVIPDLGQHGAEGAELAEMRLVTEGDTRGLRLGLSISDDAADRVTIHRKLPDGALRPIVGRLATVNGVSATLGMPLDPSGETLWVQAHTYPGSGFDGLVEIFLVQFQNQRTPTGSTLVPFEIDKIVFRVAPWIMTPNTLPPSCVYAVRFRDVSGKFTIENEEFLNGLKSACQQANVELRILEGQVGIDQWMQDEVEFGYARHLVA